MLWLWLTKEPGRGFGPLDEAAFGWFVVGPAWILSPILTGRAWSSMPTGSAPRLAGIAFLAIAAVSAVVLWAEFYEQFGRCEFGPGPGNRWWGAVPAGMGVIIGATPVLSALQAADTLRAGRSWLVPVVLGLLVSVGGIALAFVAGNFGGLMVACAQAH
jgi:hypothetical protein